MNVVAEQVADPRLPPEAGCAGCGFSASYWTTAFARASAASTAVA